MPVARCDCDDSGQSRNLNWSGFGEDRTIPELTVAVEAPRPHSSIALDGDGVVVASGDLDGADYSRHSHRGFPVNGSTVAKHSVQVVSSGANRSIGLESQAVVL